MKFLPAVIVLACAAPLVSCSPKQAGNPPPPDQETQQRLAEDQLARQQSDLREKQAALDERESVLQAREQQLAAASPAAAPQQTPLPEPAATPPPQASTPSPDASEQAFYDNLSPYGAWIELATYGYVWQPLVALQNPNWRPYILGNWAFTDGGWTWMSSEPFGWITYHYGRWMRTRQLGWVWFPGDQWAPAWVSWRYGNDFVGWAPLPPEAVFNGTAGIQQWADSQYNLSASDYTFVPASEFGDDNMADEEVPPDEEGSIYDESNNVTDIYWDAATYAVICYGPNFDFLRTRVHRPLLRLSLRRGGFNANGKNGAFISGNTLEVPAPRIIGSRTAAAPRTIRERVADTRLVGAASTTPAAGAPIPPMNHPPENANGGMHIPNHMNPVPVSAGAEQMAAEARAADLERQQQDAKRAAEELRQAEQERAGQAPHTEINEQQRAEQRGADEAAAHAAAGEERATQERAAQEHAERAAERQEAARQSQQQQQQQQQGGLVNPQQPNGPGRYQQ